MKWPHHSPCCCCFLLLGSSSSSSSSSTSFHLNTNNNYQFRNRAFIISSSFTTRWGGGGAARAASGSSILRKKTSGGKAGGVAASVRASASRTTSVLPTIVLSSSSTTTSSTPTAIIPTTTATGAAATLPLLFTMNPNHHQHNNQPSSQSNYHHHHQSQTPSTMDENVAHVSAVNAAAMEGTSSSTLHNTSFQSNDGNYDDDTATAKMRGQQEEGETTTILRGEGNDIVMVDEQSMSTPSYGAVATTNNAINGDENEEEEDTLMMTINGGKGPCRSIEEASVNTTIESLTIAEEEEVDLMMQPMQPVIGSSVDEGECDTTSSSPATLTTTPTTILRQAHDEEQQHHHNVKLRLTPEEENLFNLLTQAAEHYESGLLSLDPMINPTTTTTGEGGEGNVVAGIDWEESIKFGGGFTAEQRKQQMQLLQQQQQQQGGEEVVMDGLEEGGETNDINGNSLPQQQQPSSLRPRRQFIEIRIAGGWVRDKLLNQHSVDVDVALDCMMGVQFAKIVQRYMMTTMPTTSSSPSPPSSPILSSPSSSSFDAVIDNNDKMTNSEKRRQPTRQQHKNPQKQHQQQQQQAPPSKKNQATRKQPKIGVIGANPSQSKHLETATMNVHGMDVDFVNLRAEEVYELDSRIPTSKTRMFGTPLEDALRRDFTINSLFYNIRTHKIEDWTGRGLDDLFVHRRVVTPVDPHMTFHDDPLRVLRAIRFAVRLNFTLDDTIKEAAMSQRVHHSLHAKVSRERVGKEVEGMLTGKHARPGCALNMIAELHLAGSVFAFPGSFPGDHGYYVGGGKVSGHILGVEYDCSLGAVAAAAAAASKGEKVCIQEAIAVAARHRARGWEESSSLLNVLPPLMQGHVEGRDKIIAQAGEKLKFPSTVLDQRLLHLCVFILPFHNLTYPDKKGKLVPVTTHMVKEALKFPNQDIQAVTRILSHVDEMVTILSEIRSQMAMEQDEGRSRSDSSAAQVELPCRLRIGLLLRSLKEHWVTCLITAAAWEIRTYQRLHENEAEEYVSSTAISMEEPSRELYRAIIEDLALDECWKAYPHLNGQEIIKELSLPCGPLVGVYLDDQIRWMLLNPDGTREQCLTHLQQCRREREEACSDRSMRSDAGALGEGVELDATKPSSLVTENPSKKIREK